MDMGMMIRLEGLGGLGEGLAVFTDRYGANTAAVEAARAVEVVELAKKATTAAEAERLRAEAVMILDNARALAVQEAKAKAGEASRVTVTGATGATGATGTTVETGEVLAGKILGMDKKVFLLVAGAGVLWVMSRRG